MSTQLPSPRYASRDGPVGIVFTGTAAAAPVAAVSVATTAGAGFGAGFATGRAGGPFAMVSPTTTEIATTAKPKTAPVTFLATSLFMRERIGPPGCPVRARAVLRGGRARPRSSIAGNADGKSTRASRGPSGRRVSTHAEPSPPCASILHTPQRATGRG